MTDTTAGIPASSGLGRDIRALSPGQRIRVNGTPVTAGGVNIDFTPGLATILSASVWASVDGGRWVNLLTEEWLDGWE